MRHHILLQHCYQGWFLPCDTPGEGSVQVTPEFQGTGRTLGWKFCSVLLSQVLSVSAIFLLLVMTSISRVSSLSSFCNTTPAWSCFTELTSIGGAAEIWKRKIHPGELVLRSQSLISVYKGFLWEILYAHFAEVSCVSSPCKYEYVLWIKIYLLLQQASSYSVTKIESRIQLSSEGQWFYPVLISYQTVLGVG